MASDRARRRAIFFASDGMRHDLLERYAAAGAMPTLQRLMRDGAVGEGGCLPALPANTGAGWATLATGAWSGTSGALNNVFHLAGTSIATPTSGFDSSLLQAETLAQAAERQGLTTASIEWPGTLPATSRGPVVDYRSFYSARGAALSFDPPGYRPALAARLGLADQRPSFRPASGWIDAPASSLPPSEAVMTVRSTHPQELDDREYLLYVYATTPRGYDRLLIAPRRDARTAVCDLAAGEWAEVRAALRDGRAAGFHLKLIELSPDLSRFWLYFTAISRARAEPTELEDLLASDAFPVPETADHGPIEAGLVDALTYVEQGLMFYERAEQVYRHVIEVYDPDLLLAGAPVTDEFSHQFMALVTPRYPGYDAATTQRYESYIRRAYEGADRLLESIIGRFPARTPVLVSSDHGFGAAWRSLNANLALARAGLLEFDAEGRPTAQSRAVAYWAGGTCNVYVNLAGREPGGVVRPAKYEAVRERIIAAFGALEGEGDEGPVLDRVLRFEETGAVPTSGGPASMRFAGRTGDVVVFCRPPYQFDAPDPERLVAPSPLLGQHGYLPDTVDERLNVDMRAPLVLAGAGVRCGVRITGGRSIDLAPTLAALLGIEPPRHADGVPLFAALDGDERSVLQ